MATTYTLDSKSAEKFAVMLTFRGTCMNPADQSARELLGAARHHTNPEAITVVEAKEKHTNVVASVDRLDGLAAFDGLCTNRANTALCVYGADCPLLAILNPITGAACALHAGWRGLETNIIAEGVKSVAGGETTHLTVLISPFARDCCYEVGPEFLEKPWAREHVVHRETDGKVKLFLDMESVIFEQLVRAGVHKANVHTARQACGVQTDACTVCDDRFCSRRRQKLNYGHHSLIVLVK